ncbi:MMPL family transporter [Nocardioides sp.]|uniref:MMPL family transporter n=1 Tax=Nocardioides sp. TaxID=35761 RepID=UPI0035138C30
MMQRWGALVVRQAVVVLLVGLALTALAGVVGAGVEDRLSAGGFDDPSSESARELDLERATFGNRSVDAVVIFTAPAGESATSPAVAAEISETLADVPAGTIASAATYADTGDPGQLSTDRRSTAVYVSFEGSTQNDYVEAFRRLRPAVEQSTLDVALAGPYAVYSDVNEQTKADLLRAELLSAPIVLLLSLLIFRSVVAALLPVLVGVIAVLGARAVVSGLNQVVDVSIFAPNIITLLGLGLAVDYALFVVSRYREELALRPGDTAHALRRTLDTAGRTVAFSGLTVAAAMSSLLVFPQTFLKSIGYGGIAAVLIAMVAALTVLPAALALLGTRVDAGRLPFLRASEAPGEGDGRWAALARAVMRRPVAVAAVVVVVLLALASPLLGVRWGSVDYRVLPADTDAHRASELLNDEFGPERSIANVLVRDAGPAAVQDYAAALGEVPRVLDVRPVAAEGRTTLLRVAWEGNSQTDASQDVVRALRAVDAPAGSQALVGGLSADTLDLASSIRSHLPAMALIVVGVMLVLLFWAFGSVVLPLKAIAMNALSITASFGVVTWIFSDGHLAGLLGFTPQGFLDLTNPIVMLAVLFGLSMDYEVFLLSRVREQWDATGDNERAVETGVQKTGRIITSAALLLAVVIGAFATSGVVFMKMMGIGMLVAILIDATVVRALLVPATMKLLGRWNWWAPAPMARWWSRYGLREEGRSEDDARPRGSGEDADSAEPVAAGH